jgi:hypothetical protein
MSLSPFASLWCNKPYATMALENESISSIREIIWGLDDRMFMPEMLACIIVY